MSKTKNITKEELEDFINTQDRRTHAIREYFHLSSKELHELLDSYGIELEDLRNKRLNFENILNRISKEDMERYYVTECHSIKETAKHFNIGTNMVKRILNCYNIPLQYTFTNTNDLLNRISKEEFERYYSTHTEEETQKHFNISKCNLRTLSRRYNVYKHSIESFDSARSRLYKEDIERYYNIENHTYEETIEHFNISQAHFMSLLKEYGLKKSPTITALEQAEQNISKEELRQYYNIENHNQKETCEHFNISITSLTRLLNVYNLKKSPPLESIDSVLSRISKEEFCKYYNIENHTNAEACKHFNISKGNLNKLIKQFDATKHPDRERFEDVVKRISRDELFNYYIEENHLYPETCEHFNITALAFNRLLSLYDIYKVPDKEKFEDVVKRVTREELEEYYIIENHSQDEACEHFNLTVPVLCKTMKYHKLRKAADNIDDLLLSAKIPENKFKNVFDEYKGNSTAIGRYFNISQASVKHLTEYYGVERYYVYSSFERVLQNITKEELIQYYRTEKHTEEEVCEHFKISHCTFNRLRKEYRLFNYTYNSHYETDILQYLPQDTEIIKRDRKVLNGLEIDVYLPEYKLGIEFNGSYWHSSLAKDDEEYHFKKSKKAEEAGIRLIHIYEYEWENLDKREKIISLLKIVTNQVETKIYARKCGIKQITNKEAKLFNEQNNLQGHKNAQITYGLFYENELMQLMSFSKSNKKTNENSYEIIREGSRLNTIVVGGASKLFKHFLKDYNPNEVIDYCDFNKFDGGVYNILNMNFIEYTAPDNHYILDLEKQIVVDKSYAPMKELKEISVATIHGAGAKKYKWKYNI